MKQKTEKEEKLILAIEAAVSGGSISLLQGDIEVASWQGRADVSRAEDLLPEITDLLKKSEYAKNDLDLVAVSNGPGSYTGIRIGIATGLGIGRSLNIECAGVPLMLAIANYYRTFPRSIIVVPIGRTDLCWQKFDGSDFENSSEQPLTGSVNDLMDFCLKLPDYEILAQETAFRSFAALAAFDKFGARVNDIGGKLAFLVGLYGKDSRSDPSPNYVRNIRFGSSPL